MRDQLNGIMYDFWKTDCDAYEHCIFPADEQEPYSGYEDDHFPPVGEMVGRNIADDVVAFGVDINGAVGGHLVSPAVEKRSETAGGYRPLSARYTY